MKVFKIVFTGGPGGGKTTAIEEAKKYLEESGYFVITVPETAREVIPNNLLPHSNYEHTISFQKRILAIQTVKEHEYERYADDLALNNLDITEEKKGIVILYDRSIMDNRAYLSQKDFDKMMKEYGYNDLQILDKYDLVINLISTANGKKEAYAKDGVRYESVDEAAKIDEITSAAYLLHHNLKTVKPTDTIEEKISLVIEIIDELLKGVQKDPEYTIDYCQDIDFSYFNGDNSRCIESVHTRIDTANENSISLERREYHGYASYLLKAYNDYGKARVCIENRVITQSEYFELLQMYNARLIRKEKIVYFIKDGDCYKISPTIGGFKITSTTKNMDLEKGMTRKLDK